MEKDELFAPYSEGPFEASIVLVGEAPGAEEVAQGRPFVGPAGRMLSNFMRSAGLLREECRIENVFQFKPPSNDVSSFIKLSRKEPELSPQFHEAKAALKRRLEACSASVVVALGETALFTLTGLRHITKQRGSVLPSNLVPGLKVVPAIHPAAALREYIFSYWIIHDLRLAKKQSFFPEIILRKRDFNLNPSLEECQTFIRECSSHDIISVDIEVNVKAKEVSHIALAIDPDIAICIPFVEGPNAYFTPDQEASIWKWIGDLMRREEVVKVGQNIVFDASFLYAQYGIVTKNMEDTMVGFAILYPDFPKGLGFIVAAYCGGEPYYKDDAKMWNANPFGSEEVFRRYNAMDAAVTLETWHLIERDLRKTSNWETYVRQRALIEPLIYMQSRGIKMDSAALVEASEATQKEIDRLMEVLYQEVGFDLNPNSPKQLKDYFYGDLGIRPYLKKGVPTTDDIAMKRLARKGVKGASTIRDIRVARKMKGTYYDVLLDDDRLCCSFNPVGTKQGRVSSSKTIFGTGGNLQNQPEEMKEMMVADPGMILVSIDLVQAENRVVAYIANEQRMIKAFEEGRDVHRQTASLIFGVPFDQVSDEPGSCAVGGGKFSQRFWGKKANHALNYGFSYEGFSLLYEISEGEAQGIVEAYHRAYPGIRQWHSSIRSDLSHGRILTNCLGRRRTLLGRWGEDLFKEAYSFIPQSTVADVLNYRGVVFIYSHAGKNQWFEHADLLNLVHDSVVFQYPLSRGPTELAVKICIIVQSLQEPITWRARSFNIPAEAKVGFNLKEMFDATPREEGPLITRTLEKLKGNAAVMEAYETSGIYMKHRGDNGRGQGA